MATTATTRPHSAVGLTLDPVDPGVFLDDHFEQRPLLVSRGEAGRFDGVLSVEALERMVCATGLRTPAFRLVRDGAPLPPSTYTQDIPWRPGSLSGTAVPQRVAEEFAAGATIVGQALHVHHHPAAVYCRGLETFLECPVQANAYYTPPSARGFDVHHDTHDVFVLQVSGRKHWRIYEPVVELPTKEQKWSGGEAGDPVIDTTLEPGDTLYLPRGWPHEATTSDEASLHITVGVHPLSRLDAVRAALEPLADDVEYRRSLRPGDDVPVDLAPEDVARAARRRFVMTRRPIMADQLAQIRALGDLTLDTPLERRDTVIADLEPGPTLVFEGKEVTFPPHAEEAVRAIHGSDATFTPAELPGTLNDAGRLVLVRRLVREGYLRRS